MAGIVHFEAEKGSFCAQKSQKFAKNRQKIDEDFDGVLLMLKELSGKSTTNRAHKLFLGGFSDSPGPDRGAGEHVESEGADRPESRTATGRSTGGPANEKSCELAIML